MWRVFLMVLCVAGTSHADSPDAGSLQDDGVYAWLDGKPDAAIRAEAECAKAGATRCFSLEAEMREFQRVAARGARLTLDDVEKLGALDRNICEGQTSQTYRKAATAISSALCPRIRAAMAKEDSAKACELASVALSATPLDRCVWGVLQNGNRELSLLVEMANRSAWIDHAAVKHRAVESFKREACPVGMFGGLAGGSAPAELEPDMRPGLNNSR